MKDRSRGAAVLCGLLLLGSLAAGERTKVPVIHSLDIAMAARSGRLVLRGAGFGSRAAGLVIIDDRPAIATTWRPDEIHAYVPEAASLGAVTVRVVTSEGMSGSVPLTVTERAAEGAYAGASRPTVTGHTTSS